MYKEPYHFNIGRYIDPQRFDSMKQFAQDLSTPVLIMDLDRVAEKYDELTQSMPTAKIYYAVKANPNPEVIRLLAHKGSNFDVASRYELDFMLSMGVSPDRLSYGNTIKKKTDVLISMIKASGYLLQTVKTISSISQL